MKLLLATSLLPNDEATSGYEIANRAILHGLRTLGHEVVSIGFDNQQKQQRGAAGSISLGALSVSNADANVFQKLIWLKTAIQNKTTFAGAKLQIIGPDSVAQQLANLGQFDGIIINGAPMAAAFEGILTRAPFIFIAHNVEWQAAEHNALSAGHVFERRLFAREARMLKALEHRMALEASHVFTLADADRALFAQMGSRSVSSVPLIVDLHSQPPVARFPKWDAGLIGTWSWAPNRVGLDWFLHEVTPHLPDDFTFAIAGKLQGLPNIKHRGATLLGRVPSALDFTRDCACLPLVSRAGSGVQLKSLEAFELGLPTVATTSSIRGIATLPRNCVVEDDPALFAAALVRAAKLGQAGDCDGRVFHARQKSEMLNALKAGLNVFETQPQIQAAE